MLLFFVTPSGHNRWGSQDDVATGLNASPGHRSRVSVDHEIIRISNTSEVIDIPGSPIAAKEKESFCYKATQCLERHPLAQYTKFLMFITCLGLFWAYSFTINIHIHIPPPNIHAEFNMSVAAIELKLP